MNIGIDIDDTISETFEVLLPYAQKYTINELKRESNINMHQDFLDHFYIVKMNGWTEEEANKYWYLYYAEILKKVHIKFLAAETIQQLKEKGHHIYLITARWTMPNANILQITKDWLAQNHVEYDELYTDIADKVKLVQEKQSDIFIDDSYNNCKEVAEKTNATVYIMNSRMNENLKIENVKRVYSWAEVNYFVNKEDI